MSDLARHPAEMRIPLINHRNKGILALSTPMQAALIAYLFRDALRPGPAGWMVLFSVSLLLIGFVGLCLASLIRYGRTALVLDPKGIWLEDRDRRGIRWVDMEGYELPHGDRTPILRAWGRNGESLEIPRAFGISVTSQEVGTVVRELDRRLGPDGDRPPLPASSDVLSARLLHHYGQVPAIELEPDVVYRYIDPKALGDDAKARVWGMSTVVAFLVPAYALTTKFPTYTWLIATAMGLMILFAAFVIIQSFTLAHGFRDRFVRRGDAVWRIRNGCETLLPPAVPGPERRIFGQPTTIHGEGPFAYRMAPQFLEPDRGE